MADGTTPFTRCGIDTVEIARVEPLLGLKAIAVSLAYDETGASAVAVAEPAPPANQGS